MSAVPIPDPASGRDGEQPPPGDGARDAVPAGSPADDTEQASTEAGGNAPPPAADDGPADDDFDAAADLARMLAEIDAGLIPIPPEDEYRPAVSISVGEAADVDPAELASMTGPQGLGGQCLPSSGPRMRCGRVRCCRCWLSRPPLIRVR